MASFAPPQGDRRLRGLGCRRDELYETARAAIGQQYGLSAAQSKRLKGTTAADLHVDAKAMRAELGLEPVHERERDEQGRFVGGSESNGIDMNKLIRERAGR